MTLSAGVFKKYDIRGSADADFSDSDTVLLGQAIGTYFRQISDADSVYVGRDNRLSSERLKTQLIAGLVSVGLKVIDLGMISTPTLYWYAVRQNTAGIMITGSHLDAEFNGFKLCVGSKALHSEAIQDIYTLTQSRQFPEGTGKLITADDAISPYVEDVAGKVNMGRRLKVAVDPGNGTAGLYVTSLIETHWRHEMVAINLTLDGNFPAHSPDPQKDKNLQQLQRLVLDNRADVGLIFDGDADRVAAVDETGKIIRPDRLLALLAQDVLARFPGAAIIADVTCSQTVFDVIQQHNGKPVMWMTGHSLIKEKMHDTQAILAGEISGHIFFAEDYYGFDDAYLAAGKLLGILSHTSQTLSELDAALPQYFGTKVYRPSCDLRIVPDVLHTLKQDLQGKADIFELDGIRANFPHGWFIVRGSNTEPVLSIRIEGKTKADAETYREVLVTTLRKFDKIVLGDLTDNL